MPKYYEDGIRMDYWDLLKLLRTMKKKDPLRPVFSRWLKRTREAMEAAGIDPGKDPGKGPLRS